jgi:hypothetical protein
MEFIHLANERAYGCEETSGIVPINHPNTSNGNIVNVRFQLMTQREETAEDSDESAVDRKRDPVYCVRVPFPFHT